MKRKKKRPSPWDYPDPVAARDAIITAIEFPRFAALGIDPGSRGIGLAVCEFNAAARLLAVAVLPLPRDASDACRELVTLFVETGSLYRGTGICLAAIERQPGVAKRAVVRVEGWLYAAAMAHCPTPVYVQPKRRDAPFGFSARDEKIIRRDISPAGATPKQAEKLREHAYSALWMVRTALEKYFTET